MGIKKEFDDLEDKDELKAFLEEAPEWIMIGINPQRIPDYIVSAKIENQEIFAQLLYVMMLEERKFAELITSVAFSYITRD